MQSRSQTCLSAEISFWTHVCSTVPAIEKRLKALRRLDGQDVNIPDTIPQCPTRLRIISVETDAREDACSLLSARFTGSAHL